jgi:hypothetical protein
MRQRWHDLLFAHWPVDIAHLRPLVPPQLEIQSHSGSAWLGVIPFRMSGVRLRGWPTAPWLSSFAELNVRTYVENGGKPGVYFFSLDAASTLAVAVARRWYRLPYFRARMKCLEIPNWIHYDCVRKHTGAPPAEFLARYRPDGDAAPAPHGSLEYFFTERYRLYTSGKRGALFAADIHHAPWPLQPARADIEVNTMAQAVGLSLPDSPPHLLFARRLDVLIWPLAPA